MFLCTWQEIQLKDSDVIRALFERATSLSLPPKKMKVCTYFIYPILLLFFLPVILNKAIFFLGQNLQFLFKKYLEYEKSQGDDDRIEYVKKRAIEYVESTMAL